MLFRASLDTALDQVLESNPASAPFPALDYGAMGWCGLYPLICSTLLSAFTRIFIRDPHSTYEIKGLVSTIAVEGTHGKSDRYPRKLIAEHYNFLRVDHRSHDWRRRTQKTFYDLLDKQPNMTLEELRLIIRSTRAYPYDILLFRESN